MEKACESLAPTFEKFANFNELKVAQKETENYVKSIKKFNVRTKINQEYSERILKLEKSIDFLERTNEKNQRMVKTPIIEQVKRIDSAIIQRPSSPTDSVSSSGSYKKLNRSSSWTSNRALELATSKSNDSTESQLESKDKTKTSAGIALELEVPPKAESSKNVTTSTVTADVTANVAAGASTTNKIEEKVKSPSGKPPIPSFQERVNNKPSWVKEKVEDVVTSSTTTTTVAATDSTTVAAAITETKTNLSSSWIKEKETTVESEPNISTSSTSSASLTSTSTVATSNTAATTTQTVSERGSSTTSMIAPDDLAAIAMGIAPTTSVTSTPATPNRTSKNLTIGADTPAADKKTTESKKDGNDSSNNSSAVGTPSASSKRKTLTEEGPNLSTVSNSGREKIVVEKKVLSRASWIKKDGEDIGLNNTTTSSGKMPSAFPETGVPSLSHSNSASEVDNGGVGKLGRGLYVPKPDSKLPAPAEIPQSTVVKSIVSQINISKTLNSSFYEKKLQQSGSPNHSFTSSSLPRINESKSGDSTNELLGPVELKTESKKSWKELAEPLSVPVPPPVAPVNPVSTAAITSLLAAEEANYQSNATSRSNSRGYHRRTPSNGSSASSRYSEVETLVIESTVSSQPHTEASKNMPQKNDFGAKSWREFSKTQSNSNETAQVSTYEAANTTGVAKKEEGIAIRATSNYSTGLSVERLPSPNSAGPTSAFTSRASFSLSKDEGINVSGKFNNNNTTTSTSGTPKFQPKLNTTFTDAKSSPSGSPSSANISPTNNTASSNMIGGSPFTSSNTPPRITGSKGLISAISLNRQKAEAAAGTNITNTGPNSNNSSPHAFTTSPSFRGTPEAEKKTIPTRNSLDLKVTDSQYKVNSSPVVSPHRVNNGKEFEMGVENVPTEIVTRPPANDSRNGNGSAPSTPRGTFVRIPSGTSASRDEMETGSAVTTDSKTGAKKKRLSVKGMVKRVNSLFGGSPQKTETTTTTITEQNLNKQQMALVQEKKQSFIEKKIDAETTIVTNTPVIKPASNDVDFSFIEHIKGDDDLSSVDHSEDHQKKAAAAAPEQQFQSETSSQVAGGVKEEKTHKSLTKRISGLVKKTSSVFSKFTGAPEPPPRPENLPKPPTQKQPSSGIAISPSDSFDVPAIVKLSEMEKNDPFQPEIRPILKNGPNRVDSERSLPVETNSLGTIDKMIQQQQQQGDQVEEESTADDKFDPNSSKPRKFKPVKFLKKTFTSMSKMI